MPLLLLSSSPPPSPPPSPLFLFCLFFGTSGAVPWGGGSVTVLRWALDMFMFPCHCFSPVSQLGSLPGLSASSRHLYFLV